MRGTLWAWRATSVVGYAAVAACLAVGGRPAPGMPTLTAQEAGGPPARPASQPTTHSAPSSAESAEKLEQGRRRFDQAFYELALKSFDQAEPSNPLDSAVGAANCLIRLGRPREALSRLDRAAPESRNRDAWHLAHGETLEALGRFDDALAAYESALRLAPASIEARARLGLLLAYVGRDDAAIAALNPLAALDPKAYPDDPAVRALLARGRLTLMELNPPADLADATSHILNAILLPAANGAHRARWIARLEMADLLASKHNAFEARKDYEAVLKLNPRVAEPYLGLARLVFEGNDYERMGEHLTQALSVGPANPAVLRSLAGLRLVLEDPSAAMAALQKVLDVNPNDLEALALATSISLFIRRDADAAEFTRRAAAVNPRSARFHGTVGLWLLSRRRFDDAERHLKLAIEFSPHRPDYLCELGHLCMMRGRESEGGALLRRARENDPFNERVVNLINLLRELEGMARIETDHFTLRYDGKRDALIGPAAAEWLEKCYVEIGGIFDYQPPQKTMVEIFPTRDAFAIRISGRPWVGTVGASSGPVIACCSPRKENWAAYGWADCLRHEYVHTVTLGATNYEIPRWLTEGLAVWHEGGSPGWTWTLLMADKYRAGALFTTRSIEAGFLRPKTGDSVSQAYAQSRLMVQFLIERFGADVFSRLLPAYRTLRDERLVFERTLGLSAGQFERDFDAWLGGQVAAWGFPGRKFPTPDDLRARLAADSRDADAIGMKARLELLENRREEARRLSNRALELNERQGDALLVCVMTPDPPPAQEAPEVRARRLDDAYEEARPLAEIMPDDPQALLLVAELAKETDRKPRAAELFALLASRSVSCTPAHTALAEMYAEAGDIEAAYPHFQEWAQQSRDDAKPAIRLAELLENEGKPQTAITWAERVLRIDPFSIDHYKRLGRLLVAAERWNEAVKPLRICADATPTDDAVWADLADALAHAGQRDEAVRAAEKAIALNADSRAQKILESLESDAPPRP